MIGVWFLSSFSDNLYHYGVNDMRRGIRGKNIYEFIKHRYS